MSSTCKKISEEQAECAARIKLVHDKLRKGTRNLGLSEAWNAHLNDSKLLCQYAKDMQTLSEKFWAKNNSGPRISYCRIQWTIKMINDYFKECEINPVKVLDVGSCYNPLEGTEGLKVYPIDLFPAKEGIKKCDFLQSKVQTLETDQWFTSDENIIPENFFDVVVFMLVLEYMPAASQRILSVKQARRVLKNNGLLIIITPDSCHPSKNAGLMKKWRMALYELGFKLIKIDKLKHLYCLAYKKCHDFKASGVSLEDLFAIPKDYILSDDLDSMKFNNNVYNRGNNESVVSYFNELPFESIIS